MARLTNLAMVRILPCEISAGVKSSCGACEFAPALSHGELNPQFYYKIFIRDLQCWSSAQADWPVLVKMCRRWGMQILRNTTGKCPLPSLQSWSVTMCAYIGYYWIRKSVLRHVTAIEVPNDTSNIALCSLSQHIRNDHRANGCPCALPACLFRLSELERRWR